jgi:hypothetical protein
MHRRGINHSSIQASPLGLACHPNGQKLQPQYRSRAITEIPLPLGCIVPRVAPSTGQRAGLTGRGLG